MEGFNQKNSLATYQNIIVGEWEAAVSPNRMSSFIGSGSYLRKAVSIHKKTCPIMDTI